MASTAQSRVHQDLLGLFEKARLPTSPAVAARILQLIDEPGASAGQFTQMIEADPALAGRLLKMANSARYAQRVPVTTIQRAVTVLGLRQLRVVVLGFELVSHLDRLGAAPFDLQAFWRTAVLRACVAREVARRVVSDMAEEAFLVGLLQDAGMLLLAQTLGGAYGELCRAGLGPSAFHARERTQFPYTHTEAAAALASMWALPETIAVPMSRHHERVGRSGDSPAAQRLAAVAHFAGSLPFTPEGGLAADSGGLGEYACSTLGLDEKLLRECMDEAARAFGPIAEMFGSGRAASLDVAELLQEANRRLQEHATESADYVREIEAERDQILDEQITLRNALGQYRAQAARDPLTGLLNRRALLDAAVYCVRRTELSGGPVTVLFLDLDDFKAVNDQFGHRVGDGVIQLLAETIRSVMSAKSFAGRYGGEEFVVVAPDLTEPEARRFADAMLEAVRGLCVPGASPPRPLTCSIGAVWAEPQRGQTPEALLEKADELMYVAKRGGKNHCCFRALKTTAADRPAAADAGAGGAPAVLASIDPSPERFRRAAEALNNEQPPWAATHRKQARLGVCVPCTVCVFMGNHAPMRRESAFVRNLSSGGVGLLASLPLVRGDVVELALDVSERLLYLAGVVAFCRPVEEGIFDIGVQLYQQEREPILSREGGGIHDLDWVVQVLGERAELASEPARRSA